MAEELGVDKREQGQPAEMKALASKVQSAGLASSLAIHFILFAAAVAGSWILFGPHSILFEADNASVAPPKIVVIDPFAIQHAKKVELQAKTNSIDEVLKDTELFSTEFERVLAEYRAAGMIVITKNAVLAAPQSLDVTPVVAERLGVKLE